MVKMDAGPERESPAKGGSRVRGALGAFLGAFLGALVSDLLLFLIPDSAGGSAMLVSLILVGWTACRGYRLLGGYRSMRFAQWTVRLALLLSQPLALAAALTLVSLYRRYGTLAVHADTLYITFARAAGSLWEGGSLGYWAMLFCISLFFVRLSWGGLLKYVDPGWYHDPRRLARMGGGGATFNVPPCWPLPPAEQIPAQFEVDKGRLRVEGDVITYKAWGKPPRSFSINDVAGVVLGVSTGYNILYDRDSRILARFAWSRKNALVFGQYLIQRQVPFVDLNGAPVAMQAAEQPPVSRQFTVREGKFCLALGWIGTMLLGGATLVCLLLLEGWERLGYTLLGLPLLALFVSLLLCYYNRRLEVDGEELTYTTSFGRTTRFRASQVGDIVWSVNGCKLKDREGKTLARFENNMKNAGLLAAYWNEYKRERTE